MPIERISWREINVDNVELVTLTQNSKLALQSYKFVIGLESGHDNSYEVGAPQSLTRLVKLVRGDWSRKNVPLLIDDFSRKGVSYAAKEAVDQGALAPLNLSMNRLYTVLGWAATSRGGTRLALLRKIDKALHPDFRHWLGQLQFAVLLSHPRMILNESDHARFWRGWDGDNMMDYKKQLKWEPLEVCAIMKNGDKYIVEV